MIETNYTHAVHYRGVVQNCTEATYAEVCEGLIAALGPSTPDDYPKVFPLHVVAVPPPVKAGEVDTVAKARIAGQEDIALTAGFAPKPPVYEAGTRVVETGVDNARRMQQTHDEKPLAVTLAKDLVETVRAERRRDMPPVKVSDLRMSKLGLVVLPSAMGEVGLGPALAMNERTFGSLMGRMPCASGIAYLRDCTPELRAVNFNHWAVALAERERQEGGKDAAAAVLRTRSPDGKRPTVFAAVTPSYTAFDCDKIGKALSLALPEDARGSLAYDGQRMRLESLWRTNIAPGEFAAGEFFKAGVIVRADDTGAGSIRVQSVLWRNLCLNLIILDKAIGVDIRIRHLGSVEALAERFRAAFGQALTSVEGFRKAWGYAAAEKDEALATRVRAVAGEEVLGMSPMDMLPGLFNGILDADLVPIRGSRKDVIPKLLEMHRQDEAAETYGVSRASVVNALTRYAHQIETDPFIADEIREGAGGLLSGHKGGAPRPLPYKAVG